MESPRQAADYYRRNADGIGALHPCVADLAVVLAEGLSAAVTGKCPAL